MPDPSKRLAIIVDIDGTVALKGDRDPYDMSTVLHDKPNMPVISVVGAMQVCGYFTLFTSGRYEIARADTALWLQREGLIENHVAGNGHGEDNGLHGWKLFMRPDGDGRGDDLLKDEIFQTQIEPFFDVVCVFDDRNRVVRMWREKHGLTVFQVAEGNF